MKKIVFLALALLACLHVSVAQKSTQPQLRHVVIFKFKDSSSPADVEKVAAAFAALPKQIKQIKAFEWGINKSPEHFDQGFTHCFMVTFASEKDRDEIYQKHPAHKAFQAVLGPHMEKVFVVDYWTK